MKHRLKTIAVLGTVTVLVGVLAACGSDDKKASPSPTTTATSPTASGGAAPGPTSAAPTGDPIVIGMIGTFSSATQAAVGDPLVPRKALEAWTKWVNAHGGINGHPLKVFVEDDGNDPVKSKAAIQKLVEDDHVIAIVDSYDSGFDASWADYITSKNIPVIGGTAYTLNWLKSPFFMSGVDVIGGVGSAPLASKQNGYKSYAAVLCSELAACAQAIPLEKTGADKAGITFAGGFLASNTAANYTSQCVELKKAGADIVSLAGPNPVRMKQDCDRQGYSPEWFLPSSALTVQSAKDLGNALSTVEVFPWFYDGPETKDFHDAMTQYGGFDEKNDSEVSALAWVAGLMFQKAVELSGATGVPTSADLFKGLNLFNGETLGGLTGPLTFGDPRPNGGRNLCYFTAQYKDGAFSAPQGLKSSCLTP
jgi:branched-chain amino acid transport system substrate-binding protein